MVANYNHEKKPKYFSSYIFIAFSSLALLVVSQIVLTREWSKDIWDKILVSTLYWI